MKANTGPGDGQDGECGKERLVHVGVPSYRRERPEIFRSPSRHCHAHSHDKRGPPQEAHVAENTAREPLPGRKLTDMQVIQSTKLSNVCYEIRGPVLEEAMRLEAAGHRMSSARYPDYGY